jgi:hypothetical protein
LMINSTYRPTYSSVASPKIATVARNIVRTARREGPDRDGATVTGAIWVAGSTRPHRGLDGYRGVGPSARPGRRGGGPEPGRTAIQRYPAGSREPLRSRGEDGAGCRAAGLHTG